MRNIKWRAALGFGCSSSPARGSATEGKACIEMVEAIRGGLPPGVELDEREEAILDLAARQARG